MLNTSFLLNTQSETTATESHAKVQFQLSIFFALILSCWATVAKVVLSPVVPEISTSQPLTFQLVRDHVIAAGQECWVRIMILQQYGLDCFHNPHYFGQSIATGYTVCTKRLKLNL